MTDDFILKWDAQNEQLIGEDPETGNTIPIAFDEITANGATVDQLRPTEPHQRTINPTLYDATTGVGTSADPWTNPDNTAGIQTAVDELESDRTGKVLLPSGEYTIDDTVSLTRGSMRLEGAISGYNEGGPPTEEAFVGTKFLLADGVDGMTVNGYNAPDGNRNRNSQIEHIYMYGTQNQNGIRLPQNKNIEQVSFKDLHIMDCEFGFLADSQCDGSRFIGCSFQNCKDGMRFGPDSTTQYTRILNCDLSANNRQAMSIDWGASVGMVVITDCNFIANYGPVFIGNNVNLLQNSLIERTNGNGADIQGGGNVIGNCQFRNNGGDGIRIASGIRNLIVGCHFVGNGTPIRLQSNPNHPARPGEPTKETVITGNNIGYEDVALDDEVRTVVNGVSENNGNPATTGQWNGEASAALELGAHTVWDTSTDPPTAYQPHIDAGSGVGWVEKNYTAA